MVTYNSFFHIVKNKIIRKPVLPDCRKCVNYVPYRKENSIALSEVLDTCTKFVRTDNNVNFKYESIGKCRQDETKCGELGKLFVSKQYLPMVKKQYLPMVKK